MTKTLEVSGLRTHFFTRDGVVKAVDGTWRITELELLQEERL